MKEGKLWTSVFCYEFVNNIEELLKNDWKLHKQMVCEGINPSDIAKAIQNDDIEILQELSSQSNIDFSQTIKP